MRKQKKKNRTKLIISIIILAVFGIALGYFAMCRYYEAADFICGTWINGVYCAGKTAGEAEEALLLRARKHESLTVYDGKGNVTQLDTADFGSLPGEYFAQDGDYSYSYMEELNKISEAQTPGNWVLDTFRSRHYEAAPVYSYTADKEELKEYLQKKVPAIAEGMKVGLPAVRILKTADGYVLKNDKEQYLDVDLAAEQILLAVVSGRESIDLKEEECYKTLPYNAEDKAVLAMWEKVSAFQDCKIIYALGEDREAVDASVVCDWISLEKNGSFATDKEGNLILDKEKIKEYIDRLAEEYDTYGGVRKFHATRGDIVAIEGGTYGNELDKKAEVKYLTEAFLEKRAEVHEPEYLRKAWAQGKDDIGKTYIEVDLSEQKLYYYVDGTCEIDTPIVTGDMMRKRDTPAAVCYIYAKQKNRILRGPGYASHVNFWMPVKGGIGIHDAKWRKEFGGDIYKTNGSHGCINTPFEEAEKLFQMAEIGTPVVMFY